MGVLYYGHPDSPIEIEDRALAHLKVVMTTKLRRGESFTVSWVHPEEDPGGRSTIWIHPAIALRFVFDSAEPAQLSTTWLEELARSAHSTGGIVLVGEQSDGASSPTEPLD